MAIVRRRDIDAKAGTRKIALVAVPGWEHVLLLGMTGKQRDAWEASLTVETGKRDGKGRKERTLAIENLRARLAATSLVEPTDPKWDETKIDWEDAQGYRVANINPGEYTRMYGDREADTLGEQDAEALDCIFDAVQHLNHLTDDDVEELTKNSEAAVQKGDSGSELALAIGGTTVTELQDRMSAEEFAEWIAYYNIDPFGEERQDQRAGVVAATIANVNRDPEKRREPYTWMDFLRPQAEIERPRQTAEQMLAVARMWQAVMGGKEEE